MRNLLDSIELSNLVQSVNRGRKSAMQAEDLALDHCRQGEIVKELSETFPDIGIAVLSEALIVEAIPAKVAHMG